jgi:hypothetical protein
MNKFALTAVLIFISGVCSNRVLADAGPDFPVCSQNYNKSDGNGNYIPVPITCGILSSYLHLNLGQYQDDFVVLSKKLNHWGDNVTYSVYIPGPGIVFYGKNVSFDYIAVDKKYFDDNGGLEGIFSHVKFANCYDSGPEDCKPSSSDYYVTDNMVAKNPTDFTNHTHSFVLHNKEMSEYASIDNKNKNDSFLGFKSVYVNSFVETDHLECNETNVCTKNTFLVPESVNGNQIILTKGKVEYTPKNIGESVTYPIYNEKKEIADKAGNSNIDIYNRPKTLWQSFVSWLKSLF